MTITLENLSPEVQAYIRAKIEGGECRTAEEVVDSALRPLTESTPEPPAPKRPRVPGNGAGKVWMSPDFDEPLEEFKDYM